MSDRLCAVRRVVRGSASLGGASLLLAGLALSVGVPSADAKVTPGAYNLVASAETSSFEWDVQNAPLLAPQLAFFSPGSVGIELFSYGDSRGYAGAPYFGATVEGAGGLANGLGAGRTPPLPPTLPGYVTSSYPGAQQAAASNGPYTLASESTQYSSSAIAGIAGVSGQPRFLATTATAHGSFDSVTGSLSAIAESSAQPFEISPLVAVGEVRSSAQMLLDADGKLTPSSTFDVGTITIAGVKFGITDQGLQVADKSATPVTLDQLNESLAPSGISFKLLSGVTTPTSVVSDGLQITVAQKAPVEGDTAEIITLGHAAAAMDYKLVTDTLTSTVTNVLGGNPPTLPAPTGLDGAGLGQPRSSGGVVPTTDAISSVELQTQAGSAVGMALPVAQQGLGRWYLVLPIAALSLILTSRLVGVLAIRKPGPG